jgi:aldehyde dehydrogenase (NAD+)
VPIANEEDADAAVRAAETAFPLWKKILAGDRQNVLLKFVDLMRKNCQRLADLSRLNLGSLYRSFGHFEITLGADCF